MKPSPRESAATRKLLQLLADRATGRLATATGASEVNVYLLNGEVVAAVTGDDERQLVHLMTLQGIFTPEQRSVLDDRIDEGQSVFGDLLGLAPDDIEKLLAQRFRQNLCDYVDSMSRPTFTPQKTVFVDNLQMGHESRALVEACCAMATKASRISFDVELVRGRNQPRRGAGVQAAALLTDVPQTVSSLLLRMPMEPTPARGILVDLVGEGAAALPGHVHDPTPAPIGRRGRMLPPRPRDDDDDEATVMAPSVPSFDEPEPEADPEDDDLGDALVDGADVDDVVAMDAVGFDAAETVEYSPPMASMGEDTFETEVDEPLPLTAPLDPADAVDLDDEDVSDDDSFEPLPGLMPREDSLEPLTGLMPDDEPASAPADAPGFDEPMVDDDLEADVSVDQPAEGSSEGVPKSLQAWLADATTVDEDELGFFSDHDYDRGGGDDDGAFSTERHNLDMVDVGSLPDDAPQETMLEADEAPAAKFSAPVLSEDDAEAKINVVNDVLSRIVAAFDEAEGSGRGRAVVQLLVDGGPSKFAHLLHDVRVDDAGQLDVERLLDNLYRRPATEHRQLLNQGVLDIIERALSLAADDLPEDAFDTVYEGVAGYRKRLGL